MSDEVKNEVKFLLSSTFTLFKRELAVAIEKIGDKNYSILLVPTKTDYEGITVQEMTDGIQNLFGKISFDMTQLQDILKKVGNVTFNLTMAYLYIELTEDTTVSPPKQKKNKVEFAFQVTATGLDTLIPQEIRTLASLKDVQLAIWSTDRNKIIEEMKLITPQKFLNTWK